MAKHLFRKLIGCMDMNSSKTPHETYDHLTCCNYYIDFPAMVIIYVPTCQHVPMCQNWWKTLNLHVFLNNAILNNTIR